MVTDQPSRNIADQRPAPQARAGHYLSPGFDIPIAGDWRATGKVLLIDVDEVTLTDTSRLMKPVLLIVGAVALAVRRATGRPK